MDAANQLRVETTSVERPAGGKITGRPDESCGIAIMAKASAPGQTKTRLVPPLTSSRPQRSIRPFSRT